MSDPGRGAPSYVLLGCESRLTHGVLARLLPDDPPMAVVLPGTPVPAPARAPEPPGWSLPVSPPSPLGVRGLASLGKIPLITLPPGAWSEEITRRIAELAPACLIVACFPRILPPSWLALTAGGAVNVHPSLLPAYRGPDPLFWQLRDDERRGGVTLHAMTSRVDAGPILARREVGLGEEMTAEAIIAALAAGGAELVRGLLHGRLGPSRDQDESRASWFPWPDLAARELPAAWSRLRAARFIARAAPWAPFLYRAGAETVYVERVLGLDDGLAPRGPWALLRGRERTWIRFRDGPLAVREGVIRSADERGR